ncbi:CRP-like cAMP-binding protein [Pedobacter africanus]|uniref:CRP-like cAMP-binding protein n=1 Tax=Pedobacter africanus TaxID=151894 RepID=A0ACC6L2G9_9SPHI|nr:Crp/Fnr family transcriptional regulator [Pedobacter africanus]MDR6785615.1 CRP-like cAMP-binding protein [Pedobacter africanus]
MIRKNEQLLNFMVRLAENPDMPGAITLRNLDAGTRLIHQGEASRNVYVIKSGVAKCLFTEESGKEYILAFLGEGETLGEIEAIRKLPTICSIEALTPLCVYKISNVQFLHFLETIPEFSRILLELMAIRLSDISLKGARQQLQPISELLPNLLSALEAQHIEFTKKDLSEYLGITLRSLNRALKEEK